MKKIKLKNKRVLVSRRTDENIYIQFERLKNEEEKDASLISNSVFIGKKVETKVAISRASAVALFYLLRAELNISDVTVFEQESGQELII